MYNWILKNLCMQKNNKKLKIKFKTIGIVGRQGDSKSSEIYKLIYNWLILNKYNAIIDRYIANDLKLKNVITGTLIEIGKLSDLVIVVGGDGSLISFARIFSKYNIKIIGVNRGSLGFLTDLDPDKFLHQLSCILNGIFFEEKRFLLEVQILKLNKKIRKNNVVNEIVLYSGKVAHMIEFDVYIDEKFAFSQRADGLIIATPTGSTAYSLSAGGPILSPNLEAIVLIPMFPHTLSSRPLIINSNSKVKLRFLQDNINYKISCDSQIILTIRYGEEVIVKRSNKNINLIHPKEYDYFNRLNTKLNWSKKTF
ncbi:NAD kinase [Candidatus Providencia siddallii]|uniref:NAD kinase n=1 Tax=Candidatus Providencia siddallii TaxID=1715285 RepID=A0A0M6W8K3_9GAMM|nr:NAD kinase [Candidatus Providencia siddallii]